VLAGLLAFAATGAASATTAPTVTADPAQAAAGWLDNQFVDGTHFNFPNSTFYWGGLTASGVFALAAAKVGQSRIDAALGYMAANVDSDADLEGSFGGPFDGSVATAALAAMVGGADPTSFGGHNLLLALKSDQCTQVSAPTSQTDTTPTCPAIGSARNIFSSVSESLAILADSRGAAAHGLPYAPSAAAIIYFLSLQCPNGGFTGETSACTDDTKASVDETAYAAMALAALGGRSTELAKANAWLVSQRNAAGYWVAQGGPDVDSTGLAAAALSGAGVDVSASRSWLASQQVTDGPTVGAGATRGALKYQGAFSADNAPKATADGVLGMISSGSGSLATLTSTGASTDAPLLALAAPTVGAASVRAGTSQTVTGTGFSAGETVSGELHSTPVSIGSGTASSSGTVTLTFTVPAALSAGTHTIVLTGATSGLSSSATFTVTASPGQPASTPSVNQEGTSGSNPSAPIAATGLDGQRLRDTVAVGLMLVAGGAGLTLAGRRQRA
jgi:hypothetical protein